MATIPIPLEWQTPAKLLDESRQALCSRFYLDINTGGENMSLVICVDGNDYAYQKAIKTIARQTVEVAYQVTGRVYSVRLTGSLSIAQVEFFKAYTNLDLARDGEALALADSFDNRLWLAGGRDGMPQGTLRRCVGAAPELTGSLLSRWGSVNLWPISAISVYQWNGSRYAYNGTSLYKDGLILVTGFTGGRLTFVSAPPQLGLQDYLFVLGGGKLFKIDPSGNVTNWGITPPPNGATAQNGVADALIIDNMTTNQTANWTTQNCTLTFDNNADSPFLAGGCYRLVVNPGGGGGLPNRWHIKQLYSTFQDWSQYADGVISLQSDIVSCYMHFSNPKQIVWVAICVDVNDGSFNKDYYKLLVQIVPSTQDIHAAAANAIVIPDSDRWVQIAGAKAQFQRIGTSMNLDWSHVKAVKIEGGNPGGDTSYVKLNGFEFYGGYPLGIGPAALLGGSEYQYAVTFGSSVTGSDSNPNGMAVQPDGTVNPAAPFVAQGVAVSPVNLAHIPVSTDPQVDNRKLWRTTAGGSIFSYLDTIADNTTTIYTDVTGDLPGQPIIVTPWTKNVAVVTGYRVDGGNGFYFKVTSPGTTGANIPNWNIPTGPFLGDWVPWLQYAIGDWVNFGGVGYFCIAPARGASQDPTHGGFWTALGTTNDNGVIWAWGGLNAVRTLGLSNNLLYDNQQPLLAYADVAGPFEGSLFWTGDSTVGRKGWVYASPPGRPESVGTSFVAGSDDDPSQKVVIWDELPWSLSTKRAFIIQGSYPAFGPVQLKGGLGTEYPFTVVVAQNGIYYRGPDGIRMIDRGGSVLAGFQAISPILRGRTVENVAPFLPIWAALTRDEIFFGDGVVTFALGGQSPTNLLQAPVFVWRMLGQALNCAYYEREDDEILASFGANTLLFEHEGALDDGH